MNRQIIIQGVKPALRTPLPAYRALSTSAARFAEGDTGAPKSGGSSQGDAFNKREQADENYYVRKKEMEKLAALKEKIAEHQKHLNELDQQVEDRMSQGSKEGADK
ncbi:nucleoporin NSP1 [Physcia stellaris]|nr:nucleoporin NSP1 [Physcia stellaris]